MQLYSCLETCLHFKKMLNLCLQNVFKYNMYRLVVPPNNSNTPIIGYILPNIAKTKEL